LDLHVEASAVVYRALILSNRALQGQEEQWAQSLLKTLFPSENQFFDFTQRVCMDAQEARLRLAEESLGSRSMPPDLWIGDRERESLTFDTLVAIVEGYLRGYKSPSMPAAPSPSSPPHTVFDPPPGKQPQSGPGSVNISGGTVHVSGDIVGRDRCIGDGNRIVALPDSNCSVVQVFYATDRRETVHPERGPRYDERHSPSGQINYGICTVSIPKIHKLGKMETPSLLRLEFRPDPRKHIVLQEVQSLEEALFLDRVATSVAASAAKETFIFVHGFNVTFEDAARRTGQIAFDLHFVGAPIFFSWPSYGRIPDYTRDESNIIWSTPHFERFLSLIAQRSGAKRIHIIAHSMGNRAVCDALKALSYDPNAVKFDHLVLAAPDIDADTFRELAAIIRRLSGRITLYESSNDKAIRASKKIHGNARAGEPLLVIPGLDTIDASAIDTDFLGHSYFSDNWPLLSDIHSLLAKDEPPSARFGLDERESAEGKYYAFRAS
jgi:esterase/lipase superfamily enzyme